MNDQTQQQQGGATGVKRVPHLMSAENLSDMAGRTNLDQGGGGGGMSSSNDSSGESNKTSPQLNKDNQQKHNNTISTPPQSPRSRGRLFRMLGGEKYLQRQREREKAEQEKGMSRTNSQNHGPSSSVSLAPQLSSASRRHGVSLSSPFSSSPSSTQNHRREEGGGNQVKRKSIPSAPPSATAPAVSAGSRGPITPRMIVDNLPPIFSSEASSFASPTTATNTSSAGQKATNAINQRKGSFGAPSRGEEGRNGSPPQTPTRDFKSPLKKISSFFSNNNHHAENHSSSGSNINRLHSRQQPQTPVRSAGSNGAAKKETSSDTALDGLLRSPLGKVSDAGQKPVVTGVNTEFIEISCTRLFFPQVGETVTLPTVTAAPSTAYSSSNATPLQQSVHDGEGDRGSGSGGGSGGGLLMSPASAFAAKSDGMSGVQGALSGRGAVGRGLLPPSFTAYDVENIVHLRAALGTTGGLISSDVSREARAAASAPAPYSMTSSVGVVKRAAPQRFSTLLCGHPLVLYKVRSSAAHAFSCAPCYGMLQRYPGDTVNVLSPSDLLDGMRAKPSVSDFDFAGVLSAVERASERLVVSIRHPSAPHASAQTPQHASSAHSDTTKTREIEKIRIEFVIVLDAPTKQEVKNVIRTSATVPNQLVAVNSRPPAAVASQATEDPAEKHTMMPSTTLAGEKAHDGSPRVLVESPAAVLKSIQPVLAMLFEELKDQVPLSERSAAGDGEAEKGGEGRRAGSAPRTRARSATTPSRHGSGPAARNPLQGLKGPLLSVSSTRRKKPLEVDRAENHNEDEEDQSAVVKIGHADLTCFMGCGEELASYLPTRDRRDSLFVHYGTSSHVSAFDRHTLLADEEFETRYVSAGSGDRKVSTLVHPLPIPFGATITLKNMRHHHHNNNGSHKGSSVKASSEKGSAGGQPFLGVSGSGEDDYSRRSGQEDSTLPFLDQHSSTAPPTPIVSSSGGREQRNTNTALNGGGSSSLTAVAGGSKVGAKQKLSVLSRLFKIRIHFSVVLLMVVFVYAFAYCWRRTDMTM